MSNKNERPLVSFIVLAYNQEKYIEEAIRGAFAQTYEPLEIILSDDNSPDKTFEIMQRLAEEYNGPHKIVLNHNEPNLGIGGHINRVMELSEGEFIVVNAGDDISLPERTSELVNVWLKSGREAKSVCSDCHHMDTEGNIYKVGVFKDFNKLSSPLSILKSDASLLGATHGWDRDIFDVFGNIAPEVVHEDHVLAFRSSLIGKVEYINKPLLMYRDGGISDIYDSKSISERLFSVSLKRSERRLVDISQNHNDIIFLANNFRKSFNSNELLEIIESKFYFYEMAMDFSTSNSLKVLILFRGLYRGSPFKMSIKTYLKYQFPSLYSRYFVAKNSGVNS
ncbi:glycosyltransferase [Vibrio sp. 1863]|uniref:glycosyltransferase family 2 protein n=1 Tax=Vibrio sp. 1863 TaxID=3074579 RepID=UPI00296415D0|nr:glycosyltransferase [Vibrio sp. 1863]MDW2075374.1 glycosyltransferase [Vibrio sp. 1863]